jgi:phosphoribosylamine--glycine ligase
VEEADALEGVTVYHAGDKMHMENPPQKPSDPVGEEFLVTSGGRVLDVTAVAPTFEEARTRAYEACELIKFEGKTLRRDIGERALRGRDAWEI